MIQPMKTPILDVRQDEISSTPTADRIQQQSHHHSMAFHSIFPKPTGLAGRIFLLTPHCTSQPG
jgi:hypothetical protein